MTGQPERRRVPSLPPGWRSWREIMGLALDQALQAGLQGETPVGAVVIGADGTLLAKAHNRPIALADPTAHAEILAIRQACQAQGNYRLTGALLAVTLEPCLMCLGAMVHARIAGLLFAARDPKAGAAVSCLDAERLPFLNHRLAVLEGVLAEDCAGVLKRFFLERRAEGKRPAPGPAPKEEAG